MPCLTRRRFLVMPAARQPLIAAHVPPETKAAFGALAARRGMTESALLVAMVDAVLERNPVDVAADGDFKRSSPNVGRVSLRLCRGDLARVHARASARGLKCATYLSTLVRSHVAHD